jgi:AcrR family transcriptional regulator
MTSQLPRTLRRDAARNQELVLDAARALLSEFGTETSMEQVAARAGVGVGTVYRRFPTKEALVDELVRLKLDAMVASADQALTLGDGTGLEVFLRGLGRSLAEHRGLADKLTGPSRARCAQVLQGLMGELLAQAQTHGRIGPDVTVGDVRALIWALRGIIETTAAVAPDVWERHLEIHLTALRAAALDTTRPPLTAEQLAAVSAPSQP